MSNRIKFSVDNVEISEDLDTSRFASLKIECFATGENAHDIGVSEETLRKAENTIYNVPIVWHYDSIFDDASGHDIKEVPCGFVPKDSKISYELQDDGRVMFVIEGALLWKKYTGKLMEIFERDGEKKSISVEISIAEFEELEDDRMEILEYSYEAVTVLGELYTPAIPGANAKITEFAEKEIAEFRNDFKKEFLFSRKDYTDVDFSIPSEIKETIINGISMMEDNEIDVASVILRYSDHMYENEFVSPKKAGYILKHSNRVKGEMGKDELDKNYVSWMLLGGEGGNSFLSDIVSKMEEVDNRIMNYFNLYGKEEDGMKKEKKTVEDVSEESFTEEELNSKEVIKTEEFAEGKEEEEDNEAMMTEEEKMAKKEEEDSKEKEEMAKKEEEEMAKKEEEEEEGEEEFSEVEPTKEEMEEFGLTASQMYDILLDALPRGDCYLETYDEDFAYVYDYTSSNNCTFRVPYSIADNKATLDMDSKEKVIRGGYELVGSGKEQFSLNSYLDVPAALAFLESETEDYAEMVGENDIMVQDLVGKLFGGIFGKFQEFVKVSEQTIKDLADFKAGIEKNQLAYEIETTINGVREFLSKKDIELIKSDAENYSLEDISVWKNAVKAKAFEVEFEANKEETPDGDNEINKFELPFEDAKGIDNKGFWD